MLGSLIVWEQNIVTFGDVQGAVYLAYTTWWETGNGLMVSSALFHGRLESLIPTQVASIDLFVQAFFLHRLHSIARHKWVV